MKNRIPRNLFSLKENQLDKMDREKSKDVFFFLGLYLEATGWRTERSLVMQRLEKLAKRHGISVGDVVKALSNVSEGEFDKILLGTVNAKASDSEKKGREERTQKKDRKSRPINFDRVSL